MIATMSGQEHLNAFKVFAGNLLLQYSQTLQPITATGNSRRYLEVLEKAMYKMENALNEKLADIIAETEHITGINEQWLEKSMIEISHSSIKELLSRNFRGQ